MNLLLEIDKSQYGEKIMETAGFTETIAFGGKMLFIGILTVFSVLGIIWLTLTLFKFFFAQEKKKTVEEKSVAVTEEISTADTADYVDALEIIAVISAAIAMAEDETPGAKFKVVSFKRK